MNNLMNNGNDGNSDNKAELNISDLMSIENAEKYIFNQKPLVFDNANKFWMWNKKTSKWNLVDDTDILINIDDLILMKEELHKTYMKSSLFNVLKTICRKKFKTLKTIEEAFDEEYSDGYISFRNYIYNVRTGSKIVNNGDYFIKCTIPYNYDESLFNEKCKFDKLFEDWVGAKYKQTLYEIIGYSMIEGYPLHTLFCLYGSGRNGKSTFLKILSKVIGNSNITSSSIERLLYNKFDTIRLYGKLICFIGEAQNKLLTSTDTIKRLTGQDMMAGEYKGGATRDFVNTAKIVIATNFVPTSIDNSEGWGSRWFIIDFPNRFADKGDILYDMTERDFHILAMKSFLAVKEVMKNKRFTNQGSIQDRVKKLEEKSIPIIPFVNNYCEFALGNEIPMSNFYEKFSQYLGNNKFRKMTRQAVTAMLTTHFGEVDKTKKSIKLEEGKYTTAWYYTGIGWKKDNNVYNYEELIDALNLRNKEEEKRMCVIKDMKKKGDVYEVRDNQYKISNGVLRFG